MRSEAALTLGHLLSCGEGISPYGEKYGKHGVENAPIHPPGVMWVQKVGQEVRPPAMMNLV